MAADTEYTTPTYHDLSHPLGPETPVYPGDPAVELREHASVDEDGYRVTRFSTGTHAGTHVDAPSHTEPDGKSIDAFSVERFRLDAHLVDCRDVGAGGAIERDRLPETDADCLVVRTGWSDYWGTPRYRESPYLTPTAATWCAKRGHDIAIDANGPDPPGTLAAHHALLGTGRLLVENLTNLAGLPERFTLFVFPLALDDADGTPVRAVATA